MVSKYDVFYLIALNNGLSMANLVKKLQKDATYYHTFRKHALDLLTNNLLMEKNKLYHIADSEKAKHLFTLIDFCASNKIDYNSLFTEKTIEFIKSNLSNRSMNIHVKTRAKIASLLSKQGFLLISSNKPFRAKIVYSLFLKLLVNYFDSKFVFEQKNIFEEISENDVDKNIEKEFSKYKTSVKKDLETEINLVHQSLSLEGNSLTLQETEKLILKNIPPAGKPFKDMLDTVNYKKALDFLLTNKEQLNLEKVLEFHKIAMQALSKGNGELRKVNVYIQGNPNFKTSDWKDLFSKLNNLFFNYDQRVNKKMKSHEVVEFAADLHSEFQRIHPFVDGNSRTSRALFVHTLYLKGFPIIEFLPGFVNQYMGLTKLSKERDDTGFRKLMKIIVLESLRKTNKKIEFS